MDLDTTALGLLRTVTGNDAAAFREGQLEAIRTVVHDRRQVLVVQRTGWGKSAVYLIATRLVRDAGGGPTVIVSPLLALMRNQLEMADRLGIRAHTVNSTNRDAWEPIFAQIAAGEVDLLLISPERLNNEAFRRDVLPELLRRLGLLVVDEVHCISDWGHDFRPDYRRLEQIVAALPPNVPVLGTTATANDRVVADVQGQLGDSLTVIRGTLERDGLALQVIDMPDKAHRMAWLAQHIPRLPGAGIVYCLTVADAERVGRWLSDRGIDAATYTGQTPNDERLAIERQLSAGDLKVVVATSALAMGYDNPFIEFVIHFQVPGSPIAYYQQVGRAGRAVEQSYGIALAGWEDRDIQDWFIETAFPSEEATGAALTTLAQEGGLKLAELEARVNLPRGRLEAMLKILEVEGAVYRDQGVWHRSARRWDYPTERIAAVTEARRAEQQAMVEYITTDRCLMEMLRTELDDPGAEPCGRCANCTGKLLPTTFEPSLAEPAHTHLRRAELGVEPRRRMPPGLTGEIDLRTHAHEPGRVLARWGDPGLAQMIKEGRDADGRFADEVVDATVSLITSWGPVPEPTWVACVPSHGGHPLVQDLAVRVADGLGLPFVDAVRHAAVDHRPQAAMQNSYQQATNALGAFSVERVPEGPVLLIDDLVDSRWTVAVVAGRLRAAGSGPVYPVVLADISRGGG